jgi:phosphoenolpyruvate carboxylase
MPAPLRRDVRLLGRLLGKVLEEAGGPGLLEDVERLRRATIALRAADGGRREARAEVVELVAGFDLDRAELVARAFTVYFQLVNLAEEQHRVRTLRERRQHGGQVRESFAAAVREVRDAAGEDGLADLLDRLEVVPVLTAHPTEARRRVVVDALRRIAVELLRLDAPRLPGAPPSCAATGRARWTRSARSWPCSTPPCSGWCRPPTGPSSRPWPARPAGPGRRRSGPTCAGAAGSGGTATATPA